MPKVMKFVPLAAMFMWVERLDKRAKRSRYLQALKIFPVEMWVLQWRRPKVGSPL